MSITNERSSWSAAQGASARSLHKPVASGRRALSVRVLIMIVYGLAGGSFIFLGAILAPSGRGARSCSPG